MTRTRLRLVAVSSCLLALALAAPTVVRAADLELVPVRALGMGETLRGAASGTAALTLNPSGMSLTRGYVVEGQYQYLKQEEGHLARVAITDSTSASNVAGGLYYTYASGSPPGAPDRGRHELGLALSTPLGDRVAIGALLRYLRAHTDAGPTTPAEQHNDFTFDAGITVRPAQVLAIGVAAYNLVDAKTAQAPRGYGGGIALVPLPELTVAADGTLDDNGKLHLAAGGAEYTILQHAGIRLGGGYDRSSQHGFGTAGLSLISEVGALDFGLRLDLSGHDRDVYFGVAGRLFVPAP